MANEAVEEARVVLFGVAEGPEDHEHRQAALAGDTRSGSYVLARLLLNVELDPLTTVGVDGSGHEGLEVTTRGEDDARGTHELRYDDALGAVDDERAFVGHHREVAHEHGLLFDFAGSGVHEAGAHEDRRGEGHVLLFALLHAELGRWPKVNVVGIELQFQPQCAGEVFDRANVAESFLEALIEEALKRRLLN